MLLDEQKEIGAWERGRLARESAAPRCEGLKGITWTRMMVRVLGERGLGGLW
jgi:hypothetical protein